MVQIYLLMDTSSMRYAPLNHQQDLSQSLTLFDFFVTLGVPTSNNLLDSRSPLTTTSKTNPRMESMLDPSAPGTDI